MDCASRVNSIGKDLLINFFQYLRLKQGESGQVGREVFFYETFPDVCMPEVLNFFMERLFQLLISFSQTQVVPINYPL